MTNQKYKVSGIVVTMRGATGMDGKKEVETMDVMAASEDEAIEIWKKSVSSDHSNLDWKRPTATEITE